MNAVQIGRVVRFARKEKKVTQVELAPILGIIQSALCRVERGDQNLTATQWLSFLKFAEWESVPWTVKKILKIKE